ncbi:MAG TPA: hypothetical protein VGI39_32320 [Polyangiaceae bacterium]
MSDPRASSRPGRSLALKIGGFSVAQAALWFFTLREGLADRIHNAWWRGIEWPDATLTHKVLDRIGHAWVDVASNTTGTALFAAVVLVPVAMVVRTVARANVRAGNADPLDRARAFVGAYPRVVPAVLAGAWALEATRGVQGFFYAPDTRWTELAWATSIWAAVSVVCAFAVQWLVKGALDALLAPTVVPSEGGRTTVTRDEIGFDAVAVTPETRTAVGAMGLVTIGMLVWLFSLSTHALYHDLRIPAVVAAYLVAALGGATLFRRGSRIAVGVDGVLVKGTSRTRFYAYRDLEAARVDGGNLELVRKGEVVLRIQLHGEDATQRDLVLGRIREAIDKVKEGRGAVAAQMVSAASPEQLVRVAGGRADYRGAALTRDQLWALVEGPEIEATARRAAAAALARTSDDDDRARLRVAAEHCASPDVRLALERLADADEESEGAAPSLARRSA